jgi:hypothetical protein
LVTLTTGEFRYAQCCRRIEVPVSWERIYIAAVAKTCRSYVTLTAGRASGPEKEGCQSTVFDAAGPCGLAARADFFEAPWPAPKRGHAGDSSAAEKQDGWRRRIDWGGEHLPLTNNQPSSLRLLRDCTGGAEMIPGLIGMMMVTIALIWAIGFVYSAGLKGPGYN